LIIPGWKRRCQTLVSMAIGQSYQTKAEVCAKPDD